jgi:hypothetical protein
MALVVPGVGSDQQYTVPDDALKLAEAATLKAVPLRDHALFALSSLTIQDANTHLQQALNLLDKPGEALELTRELYKIANDRANRWTEVTFALNNVIAFYDLHGRRAAQNAIELGKRVANQTSPIPVEMKNVIRELYAHMTTALGAGEDAPGSKDAMTSVTAGGLRTVRDFLRRQK